MFQLFFSTLFYLFVARDPSWGRIEETPGEDPYVNGEYAYAFTTGFQNGYAEATTSKYMKASVTVKVNICCMFLFWVVFLWHFSMRW